MSALGPLAAAFLVAAALTLGMVGRAPTGEWTTRLGYSASLTLWLFPCAVLLRWFLARNASRRIARALWTTLLILVPMGFALEFLLGNVFFVFPNRSAVSGVLVPSLGGPIPVEEYVFYVSGFLAILLLYVWGDEDFLSAYNLADYRGEWDRDPQRRILAFHRPILLAGAVAAAAVFLVARGLAAPGERARPYYMLYLLGVSLVPASALYCAVRRFVNWRAFALTMTVVLGVSLLWEVTLAIPLGWWGYEPAYMMGLIVPAWSDLPVEAIAVWFAAGYTVVMFYEAVKVWQWTGAPLVGHGRSRMEGALRRAYKVAGAEGSEGAAREPERSPTPGTAR